MRVARSTGGEHTTRRRRWLLGLTVGIVFGVAALIGGTIAWLLGLVALVFLATDRDRTLLIGTALTGFGTAWSALLLISDGRCQDDCTGPDLTPWLVIGALAILVGVGLTLRAAVTRERPVR